MNKREIKKLSKSFQATGYSLDEIACIFISMYKQGVISFEEYVQLLNTIDRFIKPEYYEMIKNKQFS